MKASFFAGLARMLASALTAWPKADGPYSEAAGDWIVEARRRRDEAAARARAERNLADWVAFTSPESPPAVAVYSQGLIYADNGRSYRRFPASGGRDLALAMIAEHAPRFGDALRRELAEIERGPG